MCARPRRPRARDLPPAREAYHHGDLRQSLIDATEALLAERGPEGFSLREVARRSGVSPAAPAHHFGDKEGLLAAVAALGFEGLSAELAASRHQAGEDPARQLLQQGVGYVRFALQHPGRFRLMFAGAFQRPHEALQREGRAAFAALEQGVRGLLGVAPDLPLDEAQQRVTLSVWAVVHGLAHLALAGQLDGWAGGPVAAAASGADRRAMAARQRRFMEEVLPPVLAQHLSPWTGTPARPPRRGAA
ncbi:MAG: TetR/AcrR family transcriptional regulator [Rubrivivax sp.]